MDIEGCRLAILHGKPFRAGDTRENVKVNERWFSAFPCSQGDDIVSLSFVIYFQSSKHDSVQPLDQVQGAVDGVFSEPERPL
jgi:hypothetical protein